MRNRTTGLMVEEKEEEWEEEEERKQRKEDAKVSHVQRHSWCDWAA